MSVWSSGVMSRLSLFISWTRWTSTPRSSSETSMISRTETWFASTPESSSYVFSIVPPVEINAIRRFVTGAILRDGRAAPLWCGRSLAEPRRRAGGDLAVHQDERRDRDDEVDGERHHRDDRLGHEATETVAHDLQHRPHDVDRH